MHHAIEHGIDDLLEIEGHHQADGDGDDISPVDEVLELLKHDRFSL